MTNKKTLEERTAIKLEDIENLIKYASEDLKDDSFHLAIYNQNKALYEQNEIIIDYLQEMHKELKK